MLLIFIGIIADRTMVDFPDVPDQFSPFLLPVFRHHHLTSRDEHLTVHSFRNLRIMKLELGIRGKPL